jgi:hypothetical protein
MKSEQWQAILDNQILNQSGNMHSTGVPGR